MKPSTLNKLRWILIFLSPLLCVLIPICIDIDWKNDILQKICNWTVGILWLVSSILILIFFLYNRPSIKSNLKGFILFLIPVSLALWFVFSFIKYSYIIDYLRLFSLYIFILSIVLTLICYLEKLETFLLILLLLVLIGLFLNRISTSDIGQTALLTSLGISSFGFFCLGILSLKTIKENKIKGRVFVIFYIIIGSLNAILFLKFASYRPEFIGIYDIIGVIIFLSSCLALFIVLPYSNFLEWSDSQKRSFKRLILISFIFFLLIFSLRFLLPQTTYTKIFYKNSIRKEIIHFHMEDYKLDFSKK